MIAQAVLTCYFFTHNEPTYGMIFLCLMIFNVIWTAVSTAIKAMNS